MREVMLTVGPRASGKSEFCRKSISLDPSLTIVSRDELLVQMFGKTSLNPYTGDHEFALEQMWETVSEKLGSSPNSRMILDTWNGTSDERISLIQKLREIGAEKIKAWYFVTELEYVEQWFWQKPNIAKISEMKSHQNQGYVFYSEDAPRWDYELFHELASDINSDGFDKVIKIDPLKTQPEEVLIYQAPLPLF